jgi:hypothetical protein
LGTLNWVERIKMIEYLNIFNNYCISPEYENIWFFNRRIIDFINQDIEEGFKCLEIDGEVVAFVC